MTESDVRILLAASAKQFYIYRLVRPNGVPFYVGKGKNWRIFEHESDAKNKPHLLL